MSGNIQGEILEALLETLPIQFSIIDAGDKVMAWNKHETRIFKRPENVLGRNVRDCHPKSSLDKVEAILNEMKSGKRNNARFWIDMTTNKNSGKKKILIEYFALRNKNGKYLGCLESTQDITDIRKLTGEKKLLD